MPVPPCEVPFASDGQVAIVVAMRLALVLWNARIGGAETLMQALAQRFPHFGAEGELVILGGEGPLLKRLEETEIRYRTLGLARGRHVLRQPRRFADAVTESGPDGALLVECGWLGACLRLGGYGHPLVA